MVSLITFRDELRARLRETWPAGIPVLTEAVDMIGAYLTAERDLGQTDVVCRMATTVLAGVLQEG